MLCGYDKDVNNKNRTEVEYVTQGKEEKKNEFVERRKK